MDEDTEMQAWDQLEQNLQQLFELRERSWWIEQDQDEDWIARSMEER